jgi:hypothetical protein
VREKKEEPGDEGEEEDDEEIGRKGRGRGGL